MKNAFSLKKPAFSGIGFITAIFIFGIALFITMEYYHIFTIKESVETDISRALNISVTMAVQDMDWVQHNSVMDTQKAQREFKTYLTEDMKLNDEYEKYADDGSFQYQIIIDETDIQKRKQNPALYDNRNDSHQSAVWNTMEGITEKCSGMVGQYLSGVLFFRMGSVWLRCRKISIRTEAKDILLACESY